MKNTTGDEKYKLAVPENPGLDNPDALPAREVEECIAAWGPVCSVCGFSFRLVYGEELGAGYIHVHTSPAPSGPSATTAEAAGGPRPICANCHCMIHRRQPPMSIEELRDIVQRTRTGAYFRARGSYPSDLT